MSETNRSSGRAELAMVSIALIVYNHAGFIKAALDSIFSQRVDFLVELVIGDDGSTDGTRERIDEFLANQSHPFIKVNRLDDSVNLGMHGNVRRIFNAATGRYIALLEGDDYWTDVTKLAKQVAVLESNKSVYLCAHGTRTLREDAGVIDDTEWRWNRHRERFDVRDYIQAQFFHTSSILMRRRGEYPLWLDQITQLDQALVLTHAQPGCEQIRFLPEFMSTYRKHAGGITSTEHNLNLRKSISSLVVMLAYFNRDSDGRHESVVARRITQYFVMMRLGMGGRWQRMIIILANPVPVLSWARVQVLRRI